MGGLGGVGGGKGGWVCGGGGVTVYVNEELKFLFKIKKKKLGGGEGSMRGGIRWGGGGVGLVGWVG